MLEHVITVIVALIGGGVVGFVQYLIQRSDAKKDKTKEIIERIETLDKKMDAGFEQVNQRMDEMDEKNELGWVENSRSHILRFDDELRMKQGHSLEYFNNILEDIDRYENYCRLHNGYENSKAVDAVEHIRRIYRKCKDENSFI